MDIQHLKYFVEVVRQESFTRAAAQLFVTQPMLTRSIKQLEESLNVLLIERTSKSFRLTDAGRILYERAQEFLMQYEAIFQTMADVRSVKTGEVRLSIPGVLLDMYFPELFASFHRQYPGIDISLVEEGTLVVALGTYNRLFEKAMSNVVEVKARGADVLALTTESHSGEMAKTADGVMTIPDTHELLLPSLGVVPLQLFAYYVALMRGCDIDKPRNLAKSVTVE